MAQLPRELWLLILSLAAATGSVSGITARRMAHMGWAFWEAARVHPDLMSRPLNAASHAAGAAWWALFRAMPAMQPAGRHDEAFARNEWHCCECGRWVTRDAECWPGREEGYGFPLTRIDVDHAHLWVRLVRGAWVELDEQYAWHPQQIERTQSARALLLDWPGDVCGQCYAECQDPAPWLRI